MVLQEGQLLDAPLGPVEPSNTIREFQKIIESICNWTLASLHAHFGVKGKNDLFPDPHELKHKIPKRKWGNTPLQKRRRIPKRKCLLQSASKAKGLARKRLQYNKILQKSSYQILHHCSHNP